MRGAIRDARTYELMTIFSPDVAEDEIQATIDRVVGYITGASGENVDVNRDSPWGRRRLSYAIRHASRDVRDGFYTLYHFEIRPHRVIDIEREIKLNDRIMRYLLTQYTPRPVDESEAAEAAAAALGTTATAESEAVDTTATAESVDESAEVSAPVAEIEPEIAEVDDIVLAENTLAPVADAETIEAETPEEPAKEEA